MDNQMDQLEDLENTEQTTSDLQRRCDRNYRRYRYSFRALHHHQRRLWEQRMARLSANDQNDRNDQNDQTGDSYGNDMDNLNDMEHDMMQDQFETAMYSQLSQFGANVFSGNMDDYNLYTLPTQHTVRTQRRRNVNTLNSLSTSRSSI